MAYKRYYQLLTMSYEGTTIEATCFTQDTQHGFRHGLTSVRIYYSDGSSKIHNRVELGLRAFAVNYLNRTCEARKYDSLFFSLFDMLFKRKGWDTSKEHHKQVLNVIKYGSRIYKDLTEI